MPQQYGITQYYADDETLMDAIIRTIPAWERRAIRIRWRGINLTIETTRGTCTRCKTPLWGERNTSTLCDRCSGTI